jgi:hypothetical protein
MRLPHISGMSLQPWTLATQGKARCKPYHTLIMWW